MFSNTLNEAEKCLRHIRCDNCQKTNDNLQFLGKSCKHVFCWSCINEMSEGSSFVLCPICALPIDVQHPSSATFMNQFFQHLLSFKQHLAKLDVNMVKRDELASLADPDQQKRTVNEFCATQAMKFENTKFTDEIADTKRGMNKQMTLSQEVSNVEAAIDDALRRNNDVTEGILQQYGTMKEDSVYDIRSQSSSATTRRLKKKNLVDDESARIEIAINDALQWSYAAMDRALQQCDTMKPKPVDDTYSDLRPETTSNISKGDTAPESDLKSHPEGLNLFSLISQNTSDETKPIEMTQQIPIFKEPDEYLFFKNRPTATFAKGATNLGKLKTMKPFSGGRSLENGIALESDTSQKVKNHSPKRRRSILSYYKGGNVLINAAIRGQCQLMVKALENGEDANQRDMDGCTAIHHAAAVNNVDACKILVESGAVINAYGGDQCETPLHIAVRNGAHDVVEYLLSKGALRNAKNIKGERPVDLLKDDVMKLIFSRIHGRAQIVYPSCLHRRYSVFLSSTIPEPLASQGRKFLSGLGKLAAEIHSATHYVVKTTSAMNAEVSGRIMEAILSGIFIVSYEWLQQCVVSKKLVDEYEFEVNGFIREGQLVAEHSNAKARKNRLNMKPGLFRGCQFYICQHNFRGTIRKEVIARLIKLGEGILLAREPRVADYIESGMKPFHAPRSWNNDHKVIGVFVVYMPGQIIPQRIIDEKSIDLVTPLWVQDCILRFELLSPDSH